jgi:hypothetical protein
MDTATITATLIALSASLISLAYAVLMNKQLMQENESLRRAIRLERRLKR